MIVCNIQQFKFITISIIITVINWEQFILDWHKKNDYLNFIMQKHIECPLIFDINHLNAVNWQLISIIIVIPDFGPLDVVALKEKIPVRTHTTTSNLGLVPS